MARTEGSLRRDQEEGVQEVGVYICWGGYLERSVDGLVTYHGGNNDCVWLTEDMRIDDVMKLVQETIQEELRNRMMWYNTKYDRNMLMALQRDGDVRKLMKDNDAFRYMYSADKDGRFGN